MGLSIYSNVISITARKNLEKTTVRLNQSLERLSTGLRINSAKDDVVGVRQSEKLNSKIRGMDVARNNIANATSLLTVAEGYLSQLTDIAQEMRDLSIQASDSSISDSVRSSLVSSLSENKQEFNRLINDTTFNDQRILNGNFGVKTVQVGPNITDEISVSIASTKASELGHIATYTSQTRGVGASTSGGISFSDPSGIIISGRYIATAAFSDDGISNAENYESAVSYVNAINSYSDQTGVSAIVNANVITFSYTSGDALDSDKYLLINGITVKNSATAYSSDDAGVASIVSLINAQTGSTGVAATQDSSTDQLILVAADGRNINIAVEGTITSSNATDVFGLTGSSDNRYAAYRGTFNLTSTSDFTVVDADTEFSSGSLESVTVSSDNNLSAISFSSAGNASFAISILDKVIDDLTERNSDIGTKLTRLEFADAQLVTATENYESALSSIRDADIAAETAEFTLQTVRRDAASIVLTQANAVPSVALTLLNSL